MVAKEVACTPLVGGDIRIFSGTKFKTVKGGPFEIDDDNYKKYIQS